MIPFRLRFIPLLAVALAILALSASAQSGVTLSGVITDNHGKGVPNLEVKLSPPRSVREAEHITTTAGNGAYRVTNLRRGRYLMEISLSYRLVYRGVIDTSNGDARKDIVLRRK